MGIALWSLRFVDFFGYRFSTWFSNLFFIDFLSKNGPKIHPTSIKNLTFWTSVAGFTFRKVMELISTIFQYLFPLCRQCSTCVSYRILRYETHFATLSCYRVSIRKSTRKSMISGLISYRNFIENSHFSPQNCCKKRPRQNNQFFIDLFTKSGPKMGPEITPKSLKWGEGLWGYPLFSPLWCFRPAQDRLFGDFLDFWCM